LALKQIRTAIGDVDSATQSNAAMVEQATAAAQTLFQDTMEPASDVERFEIGVDPPAGEETAQRDERRRLAGACGASGRSRPEPDRSRREASRARA
jgi:hypothetical protein